MHSTNLDTFPAPVPTSYVTPFSISLGHFPGRDLYAVQSPAAYTIIIHSLMTQIPIPSLAPSHRRPFSGLYLSPSRWKKLLASCLNPDEQDGLSTCAKPISEILHSCENPLIGLSRRLRSQKSYETLAECYQEMIVKTYLVRPAFTFIIRLAVLSSNSSASISMIVR